MTKSREDQRKILQVIASFQELFPNQFVADAQIAEKLGLDVQDIQMHLDLMEEEGTVKLAKTFDGYSALITSGGRVVLREPDYFQPELPTQVGGITGDTFNMSGNFQGAIINIKSTLTNVSQTIGELPYVEQSVKDEMQRLVEQLNEALQQAPPNKAEAAEAVAKSAELLVKTATEEKPNKTMIQITSEGLKQAAKNIADVMPTVLTIATQIVSTIAKLVE